MVVSVDLLSPFGLFFLSPVLNVAILNWQFTNTRSWRIFALFVTSWGPYTVANAFVFPISMYADPSACLKTPILQMIFRSSWGLRPSRRSPSGERISKPAIWSSKFQPVYDLLFKERITMLWGCISCKVHSRVTRHKIVVSSPLLIHFLWESRASCCFSFQTRTLFMFISLSKPHAVYGAVDNTESSEITLLESDLYNQTLFFRYIRLSLLLYFCREIQITLGSRL